MAEAAVLNALAVRTGLLEKKENEEEQLQAAASFTRAAAWHFRNAGWRLLKDDRVLNVNGLSPDHVVHFPSGEVRQTVLNAGQYPASPAWSFMGLTDPARAVEPKPEPFQDAGRAPAAPRSNELVDVKSRALLQDVADTFHRVGLLLEELAAKLYETLDVKERPDGN